MYSCARSASLKRTCFETASTRCSHAPGNRGAHPAAYQTGPLAWLAYWTGKSVSSEQFALCPRCPHGCGPFSLTAPPTLSVVVQATQAVTLTLLPHPLRPLSAPLDSPRLESGQRKNWHPPAPVPGGLEQGVFVRSTFGVDESPSQYCRVRTQHGTRLGKNKPRTREWKRGVIRPGSAWAVPHSMEAIPASQVHAQYTTQTPYISAKILLASLAKSVLGWLWCVVGAGNLGYDHGS